MDDFHYSILFKIANCLFRNVTQSTDVTSSWLLNIVFPLLLNLRHSDLRYDSETGSGILVLLSLRTLRDCKNYIRPERVSNCNVVNDLGKKTELLSAAERYFYLMR